MQIRRGLVALAACLAVGAGMVGASLSSAAVETGASAGSHHLQNEVALTRRSTSWW